MTLPAFMTSLWWLGAGAACALFMAVSAYRNRPDNSAPADVDVWDEVFSRTANTITIAVIIGFTFAAWPFVVLVLVINLWNTRRESIDNDWADRADW